MAVRITQVAALAIIQIHPPTVAYTGTLAVSVSPTVGFEGSLGALNTLAVSVAPDVAFKQGGDLFDVNVAPTVTFGNGTTGSLGTLAVSPAPTVRFEGSMGYTGELDVNVSPIVRFISSFGVHGSCVVSDGSGYPPAAEDEGSPLGNYCL